MWCEHLNMLEAQVKFARKSDPWNVVNGWLHKSYRFVLPFPTLQWRHNEPDCISNHQPHDCLLNRLFRLSSKKTSKLRVTGLCEGIHRPPVNSPHKWPGTRQMFPFDDVIITTLRCFTQKSIHYSWLTRNKIRIKILAVLIIVVCMKLWRVWKIMSLNLFWTLQTANLGAE